MLSKFVQYEYSETTRLRLQLPVQHLLPSVFGKSLHNGASTTTRLSYRRVGTFIITIYHDIRAYGITTHARNAGPGRSLVAPWSRTQNAKLLMKLSKSIELLLQRALARNQRQQGGLVKPYQMATVPFLTVADKLGAGIHPDRLTR